MKLSTIVKDYVKNKIKEKMLKQISEELQAVEKQREQYRQEKCSMLQTFCRTNHICWKDYRAKDYIIEFNPYSMITPFDEEFQQIKDRYHQLEKTVEEKYNNIIIAMELGGTKADLDKMLAEIGV